MYIYLYTKKETCHLRFSVANLPAVIDHGNGAATIDRLGSAASLSPPHLHHLSRLVFNHPRHDGQESCSTREGLPQIPAR